MSARSNDKHRGRNGRTREEIFSQDDKEDEDKCCGENAQDDEEDPVPLRLVDDREEQDRQE